jgi:Tol biopolymer transport system component
MKDLLTEKVTRLTHDNYSEYSPVLSPDNSYIVFSGIENGAYNILSIDPTGKRLKNFTAQLNTNP